MNKKLFSHNSLPEMYNLDTGDGNTLYLEISGKKDGIPVIFLHGGPGGHCRSENHSLFDPLIFKSILFDQRGCGKSKPRQSLINNDTNCLVEDIEKIRKFLNLDKFLIVGGSWGSTLALCYAQKYPKNVSGIILRSVFLGTSEEIEWAFVNGPKTFAPELFNSFLNYLKEDERSEPVESYTKYIHDRKSKIHSWIWHDYARALSQINPESYKFENDKVLISRDEIPNSPFMETHYIKNNFFLKKNQIINNLNSIEDIPGYIIQGRYDLICPPCSAFALKSGWKKCKLKFINSAGHSSSDPGITENLFEALKDFISS